MLLLAALLFAASASAQDWQAVERVEPYDVTGSAGLGIYRSIGARGPKLGELSDAQRARSRAFDAVELTDGGNVHRLVLGLVDSK
ncbi:hypothetical protein AB3G45_20085 [Shinella sp. S4-D37]|uniref:hypothetical protein n=1 Tax=Shinella sp. S4-D37 TaxID=3161999 RepID=UPI003465E1C6